MYRRISISGKITIINIAIFYRLIYQVTSHKLNEPIFVCLVSVVKTDEYFMFRNLAHITPLVMLWIWNI